MCLDVKATDTLGDDKSTGQALLAARVALTARLNLKDEVPGAGESEDLDEVLQMLPVVTVAGFLSARHKKQIKIALSNL